MKKVFFLLAPYIRKQKNKMMFYVVFTTLLGTCSLLTPIINGRFIDLLLSSSTLHILYIYVVFSAIFALVNIGISFFVQRLFAVLQSKIAYELNREVISHINDLSLSYVHKYDPVYLSQIINGDANTISSYAMTVIQEVIINSVKLIAPFFFFAKTGIAIPVCLLLLVSVYFFVFRLFKERLYNANKELSEKKSLFFSILCEPISYAKFYKVWDIIEHGLMKLDNMFHDLLKTSLNVQKLNWKFASADKLVSTVAQTTVFFVGGALVINGHLTIGNFTILLSFFNLYIGAVKYFYSLGGSYQGVLVSQGRLQEHLSHVSNERGTKVLSEIDSIEISDVVFRYGTQSLPIRYDDIVFNKGKIYAVRGENGAGKTTLASLMLGLYADEYAGRISINGEDISDLNLKHVRKNKIAYVDQEVVLLNDSILNNILLGTKTKSIEDVQRLNSKLKFFSNEDFSRMVCIQNDQPIKLSGGEQQKISILRALIKEPDLLVLDEPSNSLDRETTRRLLDYLSDQKKHRITVIITHTDEVARICDETITLGGETCRKT